MTAIFCFVLAIAPAAPARAGVVYRFETETRSGTAWAAGDDARREHDAKDERTASPEIWKDGGGLPMAVLPFGHGPALTAGIETVDRAFAERFAPLGGLPVRRKISVIRRIEGGANVTSRLELKDMRRARIPAGRFEVPSGYRLWQPHIVAPRRGRQD